MKKFWYQRISHKILVQKLPSIYPSYYLYSQAPQISARKTNLTGPLILEPLWIFHCIHLITTYSESLFLVRFFFHFSYFCVTVHQLPCLTLSTIHWLPNFLNVRPSTALNSTKPQTSSNSNELTKKINA